MASIRLFLLLATGALAAVPTRIAATIPAGCNVPASYTMTNFKWFNSTHNLNCLEYQDTSDYYTGGCLDSRGQWCDPDADGCDNCDVPLCNDGVPTQPFGFGPPDTIRASFNDGVKCESGNSAGSKSRDIGNGIVLCHGSPKLMQFFGDSNKRQTSGRVFYSPPPTKCADNKTINPFYDVRFDLICERDAGGNATCTPTTTSVVLPFQSYYIGTIRD